MTSLPAFPASAALALSLSLSLSLSSAPASAADAVARPPAAWLASWTASPQAVWGSDFVLPANVPDVLEVSIGHALIGEALYDGLDATVRGYLALL